MEGRDAILHLAAIYGETRGFADATVSTRVFNDSRRVGLLKAGGDITFKRYHRAVQWFSDNWPRYVEWPREIERPSPQVTEAA